MIWEQRHWNLNKANRLHLGQIDLRVHAYRSMNTSNSKLNNHPDLAYFTYSFCQPCRGRPI